MTSAETVLAMSAARIAGEAAKRNVARDERAHRAANEALCAAHADALAERGQLCDPERPEKCRVRAFAHAREACCGMPDLLERLDQLEELAEEANKLAFRARFALARSEREERGERGETSGQPCHWCGDDDARILYGCGGATVEVCEMCALTAQYAPDELPPCEQHGC